MAAIKTTGGELKNDGTYLDSTHYSLNQHHCHGCAMEKLLTFSLISQTDLLNNIGILRDNAIPDCLKYRYICADCRDTVNSSSKIIANLLRTKQSGAKQEGLKRKIVLCRADGSSKTVKKSIHMVPNPRILSELVIGTESTNVRNSDHDGLCDEGNERKEMDRKPVVKVKEEPMEQSDSARTSDRTSETALYSATACQTNGDSTDIPPSEILRLPPTHPSESRSSTTEKHDLKSSTEAPRLITTQPSELLIPAPVCLHESKVRPPSSLPSDLGSRLTSHSCVARAQNTFPPPSTDPSDGPRSTSDQLSDSTSRDLDAASNIYMCPVCQLIFPSDKQAALHIHTKHPYSLRNSQNRLINSTKFGKSDCELEKDEVRVKFEPPDMDSEVESIPGVASNSEMDHWRDSSLFDSQKDYMPLGTSTDTATNSCTVQKKYGKHCKLCGCNVEEKTILEHITDVHFEKESIDTASLLYHSEDATSQSTESSEMTRVGLSALSEENCDRYRCKICRMKLTGPSNVIMAHYRLHCTRAKPQCGVCGMYFQSMTTLLSHTWFSHRYPVKGRNNVVTVVRASTDQ